MGTRIRAYNLATLVLLTPLWCAGCKEYEPTPMLAQDLGAEGKPLVLPPSTFHNVSIKSGQADWVPFRQPGTEPEPTAELVPAADAPTAESPAVAEIKSFIVDYNALSDENDFEEMKTYLVESQVEAMTAAFAVAADVRKKMDDLKTQLSGQLSDQADRIEATLAKMGVSEDHANGSRLTTMNITVVSDEAVTATTTPGSLTSMLKFVIVDDAWYVEFPELADAKTLTDELSKQAVSYDDMLTQLADGSITAEQILSSMEETLAAEAKMMDPKHEDDDDAEGTKDAVEPDDAGQEKGDDAENEDPADDSNKDAAAGDD